MCNHYHNKDGERAYTEPLAAGCFYFFSITCDSARFASSFLIIYLLALVSKSVVVRVEVILDRWARADQVTITVGLVNTPDCRPDFTT